MLQLSFRPWFPTPFYSWCAFLFLFPSKTVTQRFSFRPSLDKTMKLIETGRGWLWR